MKIHAIGLYMVIVLLGAGAAYAQPVKNTGALAFLEGIAALAGADQSDAQAFEAQAKQLTQTYLAQSSGRPEEMLQELADAARVLGVNPERTMQISSELLAASAEKMDREQLGKTLRKFMEQLSWRSGAQYNAIS